MLRPHLYYPNVNVGRKGSVVFYTRGNQQCVRSYTKPKDPKSKAQLVQRNRHSVLTRISGSTKEFRDFCYRGIPSYRNSHTAFIGLQLCLLSQENRISGIPIEAGIKWGRGSLPGASLISFSWKDTPSLSWCCEKQKLSRQGELNHRVLWVVWNANRDQWHWSLNGGKRKTGICSLDLPEDWKGEELYVWLLFNDIYSHRFSNDICLHVRPGSIQASCRIESSSLFLKKGFNFEEYISLCVQYRNLYGMDQREFREKWFS